MLSHLQVTCAIYYLSVGFPSVFIFFLLSRLKTTLGVFVVKATPPILIHEGQKSRLSMVRFFAQCPEGWGQGHPLLKAGLREYLLSSFFRLLVELISL